MHDGLRFLIDDDRAPVRVAKIHRQQNRWTPGVNQRVDLGEMHRVQAWLERASNAGVSNHWTSPRNTWVEGGQARAETDDEAVVEPLGGTDAVQLSEVHRRAHSLHEKRWERAANAMGRLEHLFLHARRNCQTDLVAQPLDQLGGVCALLLQGRKLHHGLDLLTRVRPDFWNLHDFNSGWRFAASINRHSRLSAVAEWELRQTSCKQGGRENVKGVRVVGDVFEAPLVLGLAMIVLRVLDLDGSKKLDACRHPWFSVEQVFGPLNQRNLTVQLSMLEHAVVSQPFEAFPLVTLTTRYAGATRSVLCANLDGRARSLHHSDRSRELSRAVR